MNNQDELSEALFIDVTGEQPAGDNLNNDIEQLVQEFNTLTAHADKPLHILIADEINSLTSEAKAGAAINGIMEKILNIHSLIGILSQGMPFSFIQALYTDEQYNELCIKYNVAK